MKKGTFPLTNRHTESLNHASSEAGTLHILVTGASSGIGREVARELAGQGNVVHAVARRSDRLDALAAEQSNIIPYAVDLRDEAAVTGLVDKLGRIDGIVHAAGGARGSAPVLSSDTQDWIWMWQSNVLGTMYLLRSLAPQLVEQGRGTIIIVTSVAAFQCVDGSSGYSTSKHAQSAIVQTLRNELLGTGVSVTEISPGLVDTEFFARRFPDDPQRASDIFRGLVPLTPKDVSRTILFALKQPGHVNIDRIVLRPIAQGPNGRFHRT